MLLPQYMDKELTVAVELARRAGQAVMDVYATEFAVASKGRNDPVTEADRQANDFIVTGLKEAFPQDTVVAEESPPPDDLRASGRVWYVDPLDGTKEFIARNGEFSVMIGLAVNGQAQLGVVYRPEGDVLYAGDLGREAWMEQRGIRSALVIKEQAGRPLTLAVSRSHRHPMVEEISRALGVGNEIPSGSVGLKIGLIARGEADVYLEPGPYTKLWDSCAPEAILRAAGGAFTTILGQPLVYGQRVSPRASVKDQLANTHGLLASNGFCHERVVQALKPVVEELGLKPRET
ncbi:MAG: 3'(2'),5'-bisphosphate nucleotidase CysQ [Nitrospira sp.]|nr:3'(2'),5'-bisphosphate nucleotidase CysQ [Nitrospira sp.]